MKSSKLSRREELGAKVIFAAFQILEERGGNAPRRVVQAEVEKRVAFDDWEEETLQGDNVRWQVILDLFSIYCVKAGYIIRKKGVWYLTSEGQKALRLGQIGLLNAATTAYHKWKSGESAA